jgi:hypothetical protein
MPNVRDRMVELTDDVVRMHDPDADYLDLIAHGETPGVAAALGRASGCGLVVRGLWRRLGFSDPRLLAPYKVGSVIADIWAMAREASAWHTAEAIARALGRRRDNEDSALPSYTPSEGDVLMLGRTEAVASEHVLTIVKIVTDDGPHWRVFSVDGGQRLNGAEAVLRRERQVQLRSDGVPVSDGGRPVLGCVDLDALDALFGAT